MAAKDDVKGAVKEGRAVIGTRSVMKGLKGGMLSMVVCASNTPENFRRDLERCAGVSKAEVRGLGEDSAHMGELCGKPFNVLMVGIRNPKGKGG